MENLSNSAKTFLFALSLTDNNKIMGKVNLNKIMAFLERRGFIIEEKFFEKPMGSCLVNYNFIDYCSSLGLINEYDCGMPTGYSPRKDYSLTKKGLSMVDKIIEKLENPNLDSLKKKINEINIKVGREASIEEHEELLYEVENTKLKNDYFNQRKEKINLVYKELKKEYDNLNPELTNIADMDKKGILEYILVVLNKIRKIYYGENQDNEIILIDNTMAQYYLIKLGEVFLNDFKDNNSNYIKVYNTIKQISQKYDIFPKLDNLSNNDLVFFKLD